MSPSDETDYSLAAVNAALTPADKIQLFREMARIRAFENVAVQHYQAGRMGGFLILQVGQEAIPVAVRSLMGPDDHSICSLRGMGTAIVSGMSMREGMAELFGKATGCSKGKGGQFGFYAPQHRHWGGHGYAATQTALAAGLAFGLKYQGKTGAVFCFLGDGAVNQGTFHESLNLASLFSLPVIYLIENNGYAMGTSVKRSSAINGSLARRAAGYKIDWDLINGDSVYEIRAKLQPAIERAYHEHRPTVLELSTYRFEGFAIADANKFKYRTRLEVEDRQQNHDPLRLWAAQLESENLMDQEGLKRIKAAAFAEARAAAEFARTSPRLPPAAIMTDIYWEVDCATAAGSTGRHFFS
ncbi:thiamine pyrophosphate-dependent enzyme [Prosthecobacter sp.]|uniref:thiamine pyrophosphate-dependent enzyme n=1 Tax=Prosthecobacter sp. TaxID=1965333 RepID=UPI003783E609